MSAIAPVLSGNGISYAPLSHVFTRPEERVVAVKTEDTSDQHISVVGKLDAYQQALRNTGWMSDKARTVYLVLVDICIGWGYLQCFTTAEKIADGSSSRDGCGLSIRTVERALVELTELGAIRRTGFKNRGTRIELVSERKGEKVVLAVSKKRQEQTQNNRQADGNEGRMVLPRAPKPVTVAVDKQTVGTSSDGTSSLKAVARPAVHVPPARDKEAIMRDLALSEEASARRQKQKIDRQARTGNVNAFEVVWRSAVSEVFPDVTVPAWSIEGKGIIKSVFKRFGTGRDNAAEEFASLLSWSAKQWAAIIRDKFRWMTKTAPPSAPEIRFFVRWWETFHEALMEERNRKWLTNPERTELERLIASGTPRDEALVIIANNRARIDLQKDMADTRRAAAAKVKEADETFQRARRLAVMGGGVMHPKSEAARLQQGSVPERLVIPAARDTDSLDAAAIPDFEDE